MAGNKVFKFRGFSRFPGYMGTLGIIYPWLKLIPVSKGAHGYTFANSVWDQGMDE